MKLKLFVIVLIAFWGISCNGKKESYQNIVRPVRVVKVESLGAVKKIYTGVVQAEEYSKLAFKVSGPLIAMNVEAGQWLPWSIRSIIICNMKRIKPLISPLNRRWSGIKNCWPCRRFLSRITK